MKCVVPSGVEYNEPINIGFSTVDRLIKTKTSTVIIEIIILIR